MDFRDKLIGILWRELYGLTTVLAIWGSHFHSKRILTHCNHSSAMQIMAKCSSRSKSMMVLVHSLFMLGMKHNCDI